MCFTVPGSRSRWVAAFRLSEKTCGTRQRDAHKHCIAMRQPSGSAHKKDDDLDNEEQDLGMLEFDGVLLQDRCAAPASNNLLATVAWPFLATWSDGACAARRAMEEIKSGLMSEGGDFCFGCAFVCCASVGMIFFILYFDLPV